MNPTPLTGRHGIAALAAVMLSLALASCGSDDRDKLPPLRLDRGPGDCIAVDAESATTTKIECEKPKHPVR